MNPFDEEAFCYLHALSAQGWTGPGVSDEFQPEPSSIESKGSVWRSATTQKFADDLPNINTIKKVIQEAYGKDSNGRRNIPSAGGLYGLTLFIIPNKGGWIRSSDEGVDLGVVPELKPSEAEVQQIFYDRFNGQSYIVAIGVKFEAYLKKYSLRGYRFALIEAGHCAQEILRGCDKHRLAACPIGAFDEAELTKITAYQYVKFLPLYVIMIGQGKSFQPSMLSRASNYLKNYISDISIRLWR